MALCSCTEMLNLDGGAIPLTNGWYQTLVHLPPQEEVGTHLNSCHIGLLGGHLGMMAKLGPLVRSKI